MYFKQTFKLFMESKEIGVVRPRPLSGIELKKAKESAKVAEILHAFMAGSPDIDDVYQLLKDLKPFAKLKFLAPFIDEIEDYAHHHEVMKSSGKYVLNNQEKFKMHAQQMKAAFLKGDHTRSKRDEFSKDLTRVNKHIVAGAKAKTLAKQKFTNTATFFGTTRLLANLGDEEYNKIKAIDFSKPLFTTTDFPVAKEHDFDYVVYFLTHLSDSPKPIRVASEHDFRQHSRVHHVNNGQFDKLLKVTERYLSSNDHELIPKILALMNAVPEVKAANAKSKKNIKVVYRGLGFGEDYPSEEEIIDEEHKRKYVATSESKHAAKNFALQKGHLEDSSMRRSSHGVIIVYEVTPEAILFDTKVIDTVFNETEILIDATKATVKEIIDV